MMKRNLFFLVGMALAVVSMTACLKTNTSTNTSSPAYVTFMNVVPAGPHFHVLLDNSLVGSDSTFPYMGYYAGTTASAPVQYFSDYAGIHSVAFVDSANQLLVSGNNVQFSANTKYSIWLFDTIVPNVGLNAVQLSDSYDSVPINSILVRFLNFSPNTPSIEVQYKNILDSTITLYSNLAYVGSSSAPSSASLSTYAVLPIGNYNFSLLVPGPAAGTTISAGTVNLNAPTAGKVFSVAISGLQDSTGAKAFTTGIIPMD